MIYLYGFMNNRTTETIKMITSNAVLAALYAILTIVCTPFAYGPIQFRISEILVLVCFFNKKYSIGLIIGCFLANLNSPTMTLDILFGTAATAIACVGIVFSPRLAIAVLFPIVANAFIVGWELTYFGEPFWFSVGWVALGETVVLVAGYIFFFMFRKKPAFYRLIDARQNINFKW